MRTGRPSRWMAVLVTSVALAFVPEGLGHASTSVPLSPCSNPDNGLPSVSSLALSATAVDTSAADAVVEATIHAADAGGPGAASGVDAIEVHLVGPAGQWAPEDPVRATPVGDGSWRARLLLPRGLVPGSYRPALSISDIAGNVRGYFPGDGAVPGDPAVVVTSVRDDAPPALVSLQLSSRLVDTRRRAGTVTVSARATDDLAGVKRILVEMSVDRRRSRSILLHRVSGTPQDGRWSGTLRIPRYLGSATWWIDHVGVVDRVVYPRHYDRSALVSLDRDHHVDRHFRVIGRTDAAPPSASPARFSVSAVDVTDRDRRLVVRVRARDDMAGVTQVRIRLLDAAEYDGQHDTYLRRVSGSRVDGMWEATVTIPRCGSVGGLWTSQVKVVDGAGRVRRYLLGQPTLRVTSLDNVPPSAERSIDSAGRVVLTFTEDVAGIDAGSIAVRDPAGHDVTGTWACTGASRSPVSCDSGPVRYATFAPGPGMSTSGAKVVLNPEGSLGVTDLAGNPAGRRYEVGGTMS